MQDVMPEPTVAEKIEASQNKLDEWRNVAPDQARRVDELLEGKPQWPPPPFNETGWKFETWDLYNAVIKVESGKRERVEDEKLEAIRQKRLAEEEKQRQRREAEEQAKELWYASPEYEALKEKADEVKSYGLQAVYVDAHGERIRGEIAYNGRVAIRSGAALRVERGIGQATLAKLGIVLPPTVTTHSDREAVYFFEDASGFGETVIGPGVTLLEGFTLSAPDGERVKWADNNATVAQLPEEIRNCEPIPDDEDEYSRGEMRRVAVVPAETEPPSVHYGLLAEGRVNVFQAEPGIGKSMSATYFAVDMLNDGKTVMYIDGDGNGARIQNRLASMNADFEAVEDRFHYYSKIDEPDYFYYLLETIKPDLVIFDNVTKLLHWAGVASENDNTAVAGFFEDYPGAVRDRFGTTSLVLDHVAKGQKGRYGRGAGSKLAEEDICWHVTQPKEFSRNVVGTVQFTLNKDNDGAITQKTVTYRAGGSPFVFESVKNAKMSDKQKAIMDCHVDGIEQVAWLRVARDEAGIEHNSTFTRSVEKLIEMGIVEQDDDGKFYAIQ